MRILLAEDNRSQLLSLSRKSEREKGDGKTRYEKRVKSRFANSVKEFNQIDMNDLFKNNILTVNIPVVGETDNYIVQISFGGFLDTLRESIEKNQEKLDLRTIIRALIESFNGNDVYTRCSCKDWWYRQSYFAGVDNISYGPKQTIPSPITNPDNTMGSSCKHIALCLANSSWLIKVASVINHYIKYMEKYYAKSYQTVMYPALYGKDWEGDIQLDITDDTLVTDKDTLSKSTEIGSTSGRLKKGNPYRYKRSGQDTDQLSIEDEETISGGQ